MGGFARKVIRAPVVERVKPKPEPKPIVETKPDRKYDEKKRRGRRSTILTSTSGVSEELELAKKTLLGG